MLIDRTGIDRMATEIGYKATRRREREHVPRPTVRLNDVAARAGCSPATASRVLNRPDSVNPEARMRVEAAIRELGYLRNAPARALRSRQTRIVGTIIPTLNSAIYAQLVEALQRCLGEHGYSLLVTTSEFILDQELSQGRILVERGVEGLVLVGDLHRDALFELFDSHSLPYVTTYTYNPISQHPSIGFDNKAAMGRIVAFLLDLGHRDFAMISGVRKDNDRVAERVEGAIKTLRARGIVLAADRIVEESYSIEGGRAALRRIFEAGHRPTAVICGSDVLAFGALSECASRGFQVPQDMSVTGFDNLDFAAFLNPPLTTLEVPAAEMGRRAGDYILARLRGGSPDRHVPLETNLILRSTAAPPRKQSKL
jgi:LacI family transcriptional regulator